MSGFRAALWAEALKARRSKMPVLTGLGFSLAPLMGGFFMVVLKDPGRARQWGLIGAKAQIRRKESVLGTQRPHVDD